MNSLHVEKFTEGYISAILNIYGSNPFNGRSYTKSDIPYEALSLIKGECNVFLKRNFKLFEAYLDPSFSDRWHNAGQVFYYVRNGSGIGEILPLSFVREPWRTWDVTKACREAGKFSIKTATDGKLTFTLGE
jgi:hypothetical protein